MSKTYVADDMGRVGRVQIVSGKVLVDRNTRVTPRVLSGLAGGIVEMVATDARRTTEKRERNVQSQIARLVADIFGTAVRLVPTTKDAWAIVGADGTP